MEIAVAGPSVASGAHDLLRLGQSASAPQSAVPMIHDYIAAHGDTVIHYSGDCFEVPAAGTTDAGPLWRTVALTDAAIYRVAHLTRETGLFLDCRVPIADLSHLVVRDLAAASAAPDSVLPASPTNASRRAASRSGTAPDGGAEVQIFARRPDSDAALLTALNFGADSAHRKAFLLAACVACPTIPILQRVSVVPSTDGCVAPWAGSPAASPTARMQRTPRRAVCSSLSGRVDHKAFDAPATFLNGTIASEVRRLHTVSRDGSVGQSVRRTPRPSVPPAEWAPSPVAAPSADQLALTPASYDAPRFFSGPRGASTPLTALTATGRAGRADAADIDMEAVKCALRESLAAAGVASTGAYDGEAAASRPAEEAPGREKEREQVRAMIAARDAAMDRDAAFRQKYPTKQPTRVTPGVEFDIAHEERQQLPDNCDDGALLGPALAPQWRLWKSLGGLIGVNGQPSAEWSLYDSNELIESLRTREESLIGAVGPRCIRRLERMRSLVERELRMFNNKRRAVDAQTAELEALEAQQRRIYQHPHDDYDNAPHSVQTPTNSAKPTGRKIPPRPVTVPRPFKLSASRSQIRFASIGASETLRQMKLGFERHMATLHDIRRGQMEREVDRAQTAAEAAAAQAEDIAVSASPPQLHGKSNSFDSL